MPITKPSQGVPALICSLGGIEKERLFQDTEPLRAVYPNTEFLRSSNLPTIDVGLL